MTNREEWNKEQMKKINKEVKEFKTARLLWLKESNEENSFPDGS